MDSQGDMPPVSPEDSAFANMAIDMGLVSREDIDACREKLQEARKTTPSERLSNILLKNGYLTKRQVRDVYRALHQLGMYPRIGGYEVMVKLGQGAMGRVYKARQVDTGRIVALKVLPRRLSKNTRFLERFMREAEAMAKLNHENIVQAIDVGQAGDYHYFAMEFVDGPTVKDLMTRHGPIEEEQALRICIQVARALQHANEFGILHRDIKPSNIMITRDGVVKLCDLGLAKEMGAEDEKELTQQGTAVGTAYYISPEQARGLPDVDVRSDIYSLGATLYHMVVGEPPFDGPSSAVVMTKHVTEPLPPPRERNLALSDHVCHIIEKMMAKEPEARYQTPAELIEDLELALEGRPPAASLSVYFGAESTVETAAVRTPETPPRRPSWRENRLVGAAALAASILFALAAVGYAAWTSERRVQDARRSLYKALYLHADAFATKHPSEYQSIVSKFEMVRDVAAGSDYARQAERKLEAVTRRLDAEAEPAFRSLKEEADHLVESRQFAQALAVWDRFPSSCLAGQWPTRIEREKAHYVQLARKEYEKLAAQAQQFMRDGNVAAAIETYRMAEKFNVPEISELAAAAIRQAESQRREAEARRTFRRALDAYRQKLFHTAKRLADELSANYPEFAFASGEGAMTLAKLKAALADKDIVIIVRQDGRGDYTSIKDALAAADDGDVIEIRDAASYDEAEIGYAAADDQAAAAFAQKRDITLRGVGPAPTLVNSAAAAGDYLLQCGSDWKIENIGFAFGNGLHAASGSVTVRQCFFRCRNGVCIGLGGSFGKATIENCVFRQAHTVVQLDRIVLPAAKVVFRHNVVEDVDRVFHRRAPSPGMVVSATNNILLNVRGSFILDDFQFDEREWRTDGNCYWRLAALYEGGMGDARAAITSLDDWRARNHSDELSIEADPRFDPKRPGEFRLADDSPCRGAGVGSSDMGLVFSPPAAEGAPARGVEGR